jgi:hypothetical protein
MQESPEYKDDSATSKNGVVTANVQQVPSNGWAAKPSVQPESATASTSENKPEDNTLHQHGTHGSRTPGLRLFDVFLYPILTNFSVFAISVGATYLTSRGGDRNAEGKLIYGKIGEMFQSRGEWLVNKFKGLGMSHEQADMSKMVFFSFADGSLMAPFVKLLEDRREKIGRWIDDKLGTTPADLSVYQEEPKQTMLSLLGGRLATVAIVVPTAVALDKTGLNNRLFTQPGIAMGESLSKYPRLSKALGHIDVKEVSKISLFEAFYTSVCTTGLYFSSRFFARKQENHAKKETDALPASGQPVNIVAEPTHDTAQHSKSFTERYMAESQKHVELQPTR